MANMTDAQLRNVLGGDYRDYVGSSHKEEICFMARRALMASRMEHDLGQYILSLEKILSEWKDDSTKDAVEALVSDIRTLKEGR